jgi:hypothetical protein
MLKLLTCPRGHFWEQLGESASTEQKCPECGAPAETLPLLDLAPEAITTELPPPVAPPAPDFFDREGRPILFGYEVLEDLGRTPAGVRLYRAKQGIVNRLVLLKVVAAREDSSQQAWGSLRGEASALGKLSQANIVSIHEAGERDRQLFYNALELVDGPTLAQKVADKPLHFTQILRLMELLARAIDHAHEQGVLHRNLKPSSILLQPISQPAKSQALGDPPGPSCRLHSAWYVPRLVDFGLARRAVEGDPTDVELYGDQAGYLSPEQAWGRARDIDTTTDVYGLGGILYFLLTGKPPFRGPSLPDVLDAIQTADLIPPSDLRSVPRDLDTICRKCLARQPRRRYPSASELADDLRRVELSLPVTCRPVSRAEAFGKWIRRHPTFCVLLLTSVLALVWSMVTFFIGQADAEGGGAELIRLRQELARARTEAADLRKERERIRAREEFIAYRQQFQEAQQELARNKEQARDFLLRCPPAHRRFEWYYLFERAFDRGESKLAEQREGIVEVAFNPNDSRFLAIAFSVRGKLAAQRQGVVQLWDLQQQQETLRLSDFDGLVHALGFSPNGQFLATAGASANDNNGKVCLWHLGPPPQRGRAKWSETFPNKRVTGLVYSSDGSMIVVAGAGGSLTPLEAQTGASLRGTWGQEIWAIGRTMTTRVRSSSDGRYLASCTGSEGAVRLWASTGHLQQTFPVESTVQDIAFGGPWLAVAGSNNRVQLRDLRTGSAAGGWPTPLVVNVASRVRRLAFNADGTRLAGACEDGTIHVWAIVSDLVTEMLVLKATGTSGLAFSPSGKALAAAGAAEVVVFGVRGE